MQMLRHKQQVASELHISRRTLERIVLGGLTGVITEFIGTLEYGAVLSTRPLLAGYT